MSHAALTVKYRPQSFAQVAGQDTIKTILSRASLEQKVAPAYLFSGTRGVGKTTLARIFAKALNCRTAPAAEPCNECDQCRAITLGSAVDVVEIDGASNRGIDDVRRLKEVVGYAPMEGGYKIFIIDEAHMLSREAFNALLKTLEEPPAKVTFVMATTEPHKFPATIISRCQHFVFKRLAENELLGHLEDVLRREGIPFDQGAVRLIARRGAGSVRDSMSLLGQVLALGEGKLTEASARNVLGLAGQEAFLNMIEAFRTGDSLKLSLLLREMLDQGLDMGFFLRELSSLWRNMFMLRQSGEAALSIVELPENEAKACLEASRGFSLQHIHACWQMTLEGQRRVLTSLEPALALELLLLNLAMLPQLLSLESLSVLGRKAAPKGPEQGPGGASGLGGAGPAPQGSGGAMPQGPGGGASPRRFAPEAAPDAGSLAGTAPADARSGANETAALAAPSGSLPDTPPDTVYEPAPDAPDTFAAPGAPCGVLPDLDLFPDQPMESVAEPDGAPALSDAAQGHPPKMPDSGPLSGWASAPETRTNAGAADNDPADPAKECADAVPDAGYDTGAACDPAPEENLLCPAAGGDRPGWDAVQNALETADLPAWFLPLVKKSQGAWEGETLVIAVTEAFIAERLQTEEAASLLAQLLKTVYGQTPKLRFSITETQRKSRDAIRQTVLEHPLVKEIQDTFGASLIDYGQMR